MLPVRRRLLIGLPAVLLLLTLAACDTRPAVPARTLADDSLRVEVRVPDGVFRTGENIVRVHLWRGDLPAAIRRGELTMSMPWMGHRHHMHTRSAMAVRGAGMLAGRVRLGMGGVWSAQLHLETEHGAFCDTFSVEVLE